MSMKSLAAVAALAASIGASLLVAPLANADDAPCSGTSTVTVCDDGGSAAIVATPPQIGSGQNGPYGPAGDTPPVGGRGL